MVPRAATLDKREALVDLLADHLLDVGVAGASLRSFAAAAGTSDRMLLYYFADKGEIMAAVLERVALRQTVALAAQAGAPLPLAEATRQVIAFATDPAVWPAMRLWLEVAAAAARGDTLCRTVGEAVARGFVAWGQSLLDSPPEAIAADTARLMLAVEGAVFLHSIGLGDVTALAVATDTKRSA